MLPGDQNPEWEPSIHTLPNNNTLTLSISHVDGTARPHSIMDAEQKTSFLPGGAAVGMVLMYRMVAFPLHDYYEWFVYVLW